MSLRHHLTPAQQRAITMLSTGSTVTAAAQSVGVHRNTVTNWQRSGAFSDALAEIHHAQDLAWRDQARLLVTPRALAAIHSVLANPNAAPPPTPKTGRNHPCPCGSGRKFKRCCMPKH